VLDLLFNRSNHYNGGEAHLSPSPSGGGTKGGGGKQTLGGIMKKYILILVLSLLPIAAIAGESAKDQHFVQDNDKLIVEIKGMVCSFCAYGIEKNMARLSFTDTTLYGGDGILMDLKGANASLAIKKDKKIDFASIYRAVEKAGYKSAAAHLNLVGKVIKSKEGTTLKNAWNGQTFILLDKEGKPWKESSYIGKKVTLQATIESNEMKNYDANKKVSVRIKTAVINK